MLHLDRHNQHVFGNYHMGKSIKMGQAQVYGVIRKRVDVKQRKVLSIGKENCDAMRTIVSNLDVNHLVVSFSNEGYIERDEMVGILEIGAVSVVEKDFKRYVGATIGIHSPTGDKVGEVSHVRNKEYLFVVSKDTSVHQALNQNPLSDTGTQP